MRAIKTTDPRLKRSAAILDQSPAHSCATGFLCHTLHKHRLASEREAYAAA